jgi:aspartate racemase
VAAVGIIGGLGVDATVHYYGRITAACKARGVVPDLVFVHADVERGQGFVRAGDLDGLATYLAGFIERMARAGAEVAVIPAVTPHVCISQLKPLLPIPLINIVDTLAAALRARGTKRVALFGSVYTVQASLWGLLPDVEIVKPQPDEIAFIGQAYQRILDGRTEPTDADTLRRIAADLQRRDGVETILIAGTDLTALFDETTASFPCLDVARPHIAAIVETLCSSSEYRPTS